MSVHIQRPLTETERARLVGTSRKRPAEREDLSALMMDVCSFVVPTFGLFFVGVDWFQAVALWGICSTVAQLMHINATLKIDGVRSYRFRLEGGKWRRGP